MKRALTILVACLLISAGVETLPAQALVLGGGLNAGTIPRALRPLCKGARRLRGVGLTARTGVTANRLQVDATLDYIGRLGVHDAAVCVPLSGLSIDSSFARAGNSATSLGITGWLPLTGPFRTGGEIGWVHGHSSWFIAPVIGAQARSVRIEVAARRHRVAFDEITREYGSGPTREISRRSASESSWGAVARVLLLRL